MMPGLALDEMDVVEVNDESEEEEDTVAPSTCLVASSRL